MAKKRKFVAPKPVEVGAPAGQPAPGPAPKPAPKPVAVGAPTAWLMSPRDWKLLAVVAGVALLAYVNSLGGHFLYDDRFQILRNPTLADLGNIPRSFTQSVW